MKTEVSDEINAASTAAIIKPRKPYKIETLLTIIYVDFTQRQCKRYHWHNRGHKSWVGYVGTSGRVATRLFADFWSNTCYLI